MGFVLFPKAINDHRIDTYFLLLELLLRKYRLIILNSACNNNLYDMLLFGN